MHILYKIQGKGEKTEFKSNEAVKYANPDKDYMSCDISKQDNSLKL